LARCNGVKHLIRGNHDKRKMDHLFASAQDYLELKLDLHGKAQHVVLSHYPFRSWHGSGRNTWMLHGHTHNTIENVPGRLDVGVDCNNMMPFTVLDIATRLSRVQGKPPA
jgi:calcineurin-like phosphoesterase family protein